jgi:hypothetical protein
MPQLNTDIGFLRLVIRMTAEAVVHGKRVCAEYSRVAFINEIIVCKIPTLLA